MDTDDRRQLIEQIRSGDNAAALDAVKILRERGWLTDGSLMAADFIGATLRYADLSHAVLESVDFTDTDLIGVNFTGATLRGKSTFQRSVLADVNFEDALLDGAKIIECNMLGARMLRTGCIATDFIRTGLPVSIIDSNFSTARLSEIRDGGTLWKNVDLRQAQMTGAIFQQTIFENVNFSGADMADTFFVDVFLTDCIGLETVVHQRANYIDLRTLYRARENLPVEFIKNAQMGGIDEGLIESVLDIFRGQVETSMAYGKEELIEQMRGGDNAAALAALKSLRERGWLTGGSLRDIDLSGADLSNADLNHAVFTNVDFTGATLISADLSFAKFYGDIKLDGTNLMYAILEDTILDGAIVSKANFRSAQLIGTRFQASEMSGADFLEAMLIGADFRGSRINGCAFDRATLRDVDFRETHMSGVIFRQCTLQSPFMSRAEMAFIFFGGVDLSTCIGLDEVIHVHSSAIDLSTLYLSRKRLPRDFIRSATMENVEDEILNAVMEIFRRAE